MRATTFIGILVSAFGIGMSLTGAGAMFGVPIALGGLALIAVRSVWDRIQVVCSTPPCEQLKASASSSRTR